MGNICAACDPDSEKQKNSAREIFEANSTNKVGDRPTQGALHDQHEVRGPVTLKNGSVYEGEWLNGQRDGYGKHQWQDGSCYEG